MSDLISREEALMALTGINLPTDRNKLIALYDKRIKTLQTVEAVPMLVIEKIKAEITAQKDDCATTSYYTRLGFETALAIIDKAVKEYTHE